MILVWISLYTAIAIVSLLTFHKYGEQLGLPDYDNQIKDYSTMDDWDDNESAYLFLAIFWPLSVFFLTLYNIYLLLLKFSKFIKSKVSNGNRIRN
jgi:hypothetical protein